ncbi:MAG: hypothetical protein AAF968_01715 [Pseudomonadota bacterium]
MHFAGMITTPLFASLVLATASVGLPVEAERTPSSVLSPPALMQAEDEALREFEVAGSTIRGNSRGISRKFSREPGKIRRQFTLRGGKRTEPRGRVATPYGVEKKSGGGSDRAIAPPTTPSVTENRTPVFNSGPKRMRVEGAASN